MLHHTSRSPLRSSSRAVSSAVSQLSCEISHLTYPASYTPFTPNESEQRSGPLSYRGCWHRVSRPFLSAYHQMQLLFIDAPLFCSDRSLQSENLHPPRGVAPSDFRPL